MKILLVSPLPPSVGGISTFARNLIEYVNSSPNGLILILIDTADKLRSVVSESLLLRLFTGSITSIKVYFNFRRIIREEKPEILHLSTSSSLALVRDNLIINLAKRSKIKVIVHWHFGRIPALATQHNWEWRLLRSVILKSKCSIVIDKKSYNTLLSEGFSNTLYIPIPVSQDFEKEAKEAKDRLQPKYKGRVIFVGHIIKEKGVFELVKACMQLTEIKELIFIGPYEKNIQRGLLTLAGKKDNEEWVRFPGVLSQSEVIEQMKMSSILALPSYTEGFPNVVLEAMALGCAVVATNVGAIPEMLAIGTDSPCGICVSVQNVNELKEAILILTNDPSMAEAMGKNGIKQIENNYTIENVGNKLKNVWYDIAAGNLVNSNY